MDKLQNLQKILQPKPNGTVETIPEQAPVRPPRVQTPYAYTPLQQTDNAPAPRVPRNYVISPRVSKPTETQDTTELVFPNRGIWNELKKEPEKLPSPKVQPDNPR